MVKKTQILIICLIVSQINLAQPIPAWTASIVSSDPTYYNNYPKIKFDKLGNIILSSTFYTSTSGWDILLAKYTPSGNLIWKKTYNSAFNLDDWAYDFEVDNQNNILITGKSQIDSLNTNLIILKYNASGNLKWQGTYNGNINREDVGNSIAIDHASAAYVTGFSESDTSGNKKLLVCKFDSSGVRHWVYLYGSNPKALYEGHRVRLINNQLAVLGRYISYSNYDRKYVAARFDTAGVKLYSNEDHITSGLGTFYIDKIGNFYVGSVFNYKVNKINANGNFAWSDSIPINSQWNVSTDAVEAIIVDSLQNVYVTGWHRGNDTLFSYTNPNMLTIKYASNGNKLWTQQYGNPGIDLGDMPSDIALDNNLNVYVAGAASKTNATSYHNDYLVVKYSNNGIQKGIIRYNTPQNGNESISSIIVSDTAHIYVSGMSLENQYAIITQKYGAVNPVGLSTFQLSENKVSVVPNPFFSSTTINFPNTNNTEFVCELYNNNGNCVFKQSTNKNTVNIADDKMAAGIYYFILKSSTHLYSGKIIKLN